MTKFDPTELRGNWCGTQKRHWALLRREGDYYWTIVPIKADRIHRLRIKSSEAVVEAVEWDVWDVWD